MSYKHTFWNGHGYEAPQFANQYDPPVGYWNGDQNSAMMSNYSQSQAHSGAQWDVSMNHGSLPLMNTGSNASQGYHRQEYLSWRSQPPPSSSDDQGWRSDKGGRDSKRPRHCGEQSAPTYGRENGGKGRKIYGDRSDNPFKKGDDSNGWDMRRDEESAPSSASISLSTLPSGQLNPLMEKVHKHRHPNMRAALSHYSQLCGDLGIKYTEHSSGYNWRSEVLFSEFPSLKGEGRGRSKKDAQENACGDLLKMLEKKSAPIKRNVKVTQQKGGQKGGTKSKASMSTLDASNFSNGFDLDNARKVFNEFCNVHNMRPAVEGKGGAMEVWKGSSGRFDARYSHFCPPIGGMLREEVRGAQNKEAAGRDLCLLLCNFLFKRKILAPPSSADASASPQFVRPIKLEKNVKNTLADVCDEWDVLPDLSGFSSSVSSNSRVSLLPYMREVLPVCTSHCKEGVFSVEWDLPQPDWDPWRQRPSAPLPRSPPTSFRSVSTHLPIFKKRQEILDLIKANSVSVITGATGCGKTTQVPQYLMDDALESGGEVNIIVTQPRRIAAIAVADRVAHERGERRCGDSVGYSVRFDTCPPSRRPGVMYMTPGVLLKRLSRGLKGVTHIIVDEVHERDLQTDFLLIILKWATQKYDGLRIILMSATLDSSQFSSYFFNAPSIHVETALFKVHTHFLDDIPRFIGSPREYSSDALMNGQYQVITDILHYVLRQQCDGSILIFLPGWAQISQVHDLIRYSGPLSEVLEVIPLHSQLTKEEQNRVFRRASPGKKKCVLATNIAESSITIDDVVYVIDSCLCKSKTFNSQRNLTYLDTTWVAKSNSMQRRGRAGRIRDGHCFHLVSRSEFNRMASTTEPEMTKVGDRLHSVALTVRKLGLGDPKKFLQKAMEPPSRFSMHKCMESLKSMGALHPKSEELTPLGNLLAVLPLDPKLGIALILASFFGVLDQVSTLCAWFAAGDTVLISQKEEDGRGKSRSAGVASETRVGDHRRRIPPGCQSAFISEHHEFLLGFDSWAKILSTEGEDRAQQFAERVLRSSNRMLHHVKNSKEQMLSELASFGFPAPHLFSADYITPLLWQAISACTCIALDPNFALHAREKKAWVDCEKDPVRFDPKSSENLLLSVERVCPPHSYTPYFVVMEKMKCAYRTVLRQSSMVHPLNVLAFGSPSSLEYFSSEQAAFMNNWFPFKAEDHGTLLLFACGVRQLTKSVIQKICTEPRILNESREDLDNARQAFVECFDQMGREMEEDWGKINQITGIGRTY